MVTPDEEIQEQEEIVELIEEVPKVISSKESFDFSVNATDRPGLTVYTVSTKIFGEEELKTLKILAPSYATALELAGIGSDNTIKISDVPFEG